MIEGRTVVVEQSMSSEGRAMLEYWQLRSDQVFQGTGIQKGDGRLVIILPGLFANDFYLQPLR